MRILVGWDDSTELELLNSFLNIGDTVAITCGAVDDFRTAAANDTFDAVLLALNFPTASECFPVFQELRQAHPDLPIVGAWHRGEIQHLAKFLVHGLHSHIQRDQQGEFVLLLTTMLEAAVASAHAQRAAIIAEKLREEVASVRQLQESIIPRSLPVIPGYSMAARYEPSQIRMLGERPVIMAGGDYYNAFQLSEDSLALILGDAAGHGVRACMSIMSMHTLITMVREQRCPTSAEFVTEMNQRLAKNSIVSGDDGGFITLLFGYLDSKRHRLQWTSAGHPVPLLHDLEANEVVPLGGRGDTGLPLAITEDWDYALREFDIPPRSRLLIYSDGLDEAYGEQNGEHVAFGVRGIQETLRQCVHCSLAETLDALFTASNAITDGAGRLDDTTVVLVERH